MVVVGIRAAAGRWAAGNVRAAAAGRWAAGGGRAAAGRRVAAVHVLGVGIATAVVVVETDGAVGTSAPVEAQPFPALHSAG